MPNKTVTINPDIEVPEGNECEGRNIESPCVMISRLTDKCRIYGVLLAFAKDGTVYKSDLCKAACEKAKEPCETCGGSGKVDISERYPIGSGLGFLLDCLDCNNERRDDKSSLGQPDYSGKEHVPDKATGGAR